MFMAPPPGLCHETYSTYPASSLYFPPCLLTDNSAALNFPPLAMADLPELDLVRPSDCSPPPVVFAGGAAENELNMRCTGLDDAVRRVGGGSGNHGCARIGFRTRSEVDVLDDGFKWRKYGKKAVKGSPNPRNYYRCSAEGCRVKKRVERDRDDPRYVLTTYDGVHNHATPRNGGYLTHSSAAAPAWGVQLQAAAHSSESSY